MTKRIRVIYPVWVPEEALAEDVAVQIPPEHIKPGIEVEFCCTRAGATTMDSYYEIAIAEAFVLEAGLRAAEEGVDAICINTTSDSAVLALRSRLSIPVIGPGATSFLLACMLGNKFSVVTMWDRWKILYKRTFDDQGLWHRVASIRSADIGPDPQKLLAGKEGEVFPRIAEECEKAIEEDGAQVIVIGSTTMHRAHHYLVERLPVPVINPGLVAHKMAEMLLDLDLSHSKLCYADTLAPNDALLFNTLGTATP
ncbi:MAG: aspartate/glutamate racemase family protein [Alphaproteobacteria bacterium]